MQILLNFVDLSQFESQLKALFFVVLSFPLFSLYLSFQSKCTFLYESDLSFQLKNLLFQSLITQYETFDMIAIFYLLIFNFLAFF